MFRNENYTQADSKQPEWPDPQPLPDNLPSIDALAKLSPIQYDQRRKSVAKELGIRVSVLDQQVTAKRLSDNPQNLGKPKSGQPVNLDSPEPWHEPVDGATLLNALQDTFKRFVMLPPGGYETAALWVMHTYCLDAAYTSPIMGITSPQKRCGKTTLVNIFAALAKRTIPTGNISPASLYRSIECWQPTLLIDEADTFLKNNDELRGVINSGHTRASAFIIRSEGEDHEPRCFSTWAAKAIALIGSLPPTLHDRAIVICMERKPVDEKLERFRPDKMSFSDLRRMAARWAMDNMDRLAEMDPTMSENLNDRAADNWRPLVAIADCSGNEWPMLARQAIQNLATHDDEDEDAKVQLLSDINTIFNENRSVQIEKDDRRICTRDLIDALVEMEHRPWSEWKNGYPITPYQIARLLKPFRIKPRKIKFSNTALQGYSLNDFQNIFSLYIPPPRSGTPEPSSNDAGFDAISNRNRKMTDMELRNHLVMTGDSSESNPEPPPFQPKKLPPENRKNQKVPDLSGTFRFSVPDKTSRKPAPLRHSSGVPDQNAKNTVPGNNFYDEDENTEYF
jgi:putative DNA primase/helicase